MRCPQCGKEVPRDADACRRCGYVVGMRSLEPQEPTERNPRFAPAAIILGKLGTTFESFLSDRTDAFFVAGKSTTSEKSASSSAPSQVYVDAALKELLLPECVLQRARGVDVDDERFSDIERRALAEIDGDRPLAFVLTRSGLTTDDLCLAIALLVDKAAIEKKGAAAIRDKTAPLPKWRSVPHEAPLSGTASDTERNPVWSPPATVPEAPADLSLLHDLVVKKLRASGLPVPGDPPTTRPNEFVSDTLPGAPDEATQPTGSGSGAAIDDARRLLQQSLAAEQQGDVDGAVRALREAVMLRPDDDALLNRLGVVLATGAQDFVGAQAALERAVELKPDDPVYANNLRRVLQARPKSRRD
jgi:hypothetical protein